MNLPRLESELFLNSSSLFVCSGLVMELGHCPVFSAWTRSVQSPGLLDLFGDRKVMDGQPIHDLDQLYTNFLLCLQKH
jgi:hypothetical protein